MIQYQVFNPISGQYTQCLSIDEAKLARSVLQNNYVIWVNIGQSYKSVQIIPYDPNWLNEFDVTEEQYLANPNYEYISYVYCTPEQQAELDAQKVQFIKDNDHLFVVNEESIDEQGNSTWTVVDTSGW